MAITQYDKVKILGILKGKVDTIHDLANLNTRSKFTCDEYLIAILDILLKSLDSDKNNTNLFINCLVGVECLIKEITSYDDFLSDESIEKIRNIEEKYDEFLKKNEFENNEEVRRRIKLALEGIVYNAMPDTLDKEALERKLEEDDEIVEEELESKDIAELELKIKELEKIIKQLEKTLDSSNRKITKKENEIEKQKNELKELKAELKVLKKRYENVDRDLEIANEQNAKKDEKIYELTIGKSRIEKDSKDKDTKIDLLRMKIKQFETEEEEKIKLEELENEILKELVERDYTVEELMQVITNCGIIVNREKILKCLDNLKRRVKIEINELRNFSPVYSIQEKDVEVNRKIDLVSNLKSMDILAISDLHFGVVGNYDIKTFDKMYDYCAKNGISLIINLGDLFSYNYQSGSSRLDRMEYNREILSTAIKNLPYDKSIHQAILGGNHDRSILTYGIDPIEELASSRPDIINLGYDHAAISFRNSNIVLHHLNKRNPGLISSVRYDDTELLKDIENYYESSIFNREETYIDLFGHFHKSVLNEQGGYALIPSLTQDRYQNGAWHLKIYFNDLGDIENIIFIPIIYKDKFIPVNENVYKKVRK